MAQPAGSHTTLLPPSVLSFASSSTTASYAAVQDTSGVNPELLRSMMDCVDTTLFSAAQLANWSQMKARLTAAVEQNTPVSLTGGDLAMVKMELARTPNLSDATSTGHSGSGVGDYRQPLHREASIQDVLACLLDHQPPSAKVMSSGGNFSENAKLSRVDHKPSLKKLLSSNNFTMTEKKESLRHLLSFIDNSFASNTPEPLTQVYKDCEAGTLQRLSSLQLMRSFMTPNPQSGTNAQGSGQGGMGTRTTSFEIIQAMLNATSNQAIQKPMTSQDSFRFQHLARTLESIETDVSAIDNDDYGGDDVVQVDNLDNLLDYHESNSSTASDTSMTSTAVASTSAASTQGQSSAGFVNTQSLVNPSRRIYTEMSPTGPTHYTTFGQSLDNRPPSSYNPATSASATLPTLGMMNQQHQNLAYPHQPQHMLQQQLLRQDQQQKHQQQYNQLYQNAMLQQQQPSRLMMNPGSGYGSANQPMPQFPSMLIQPECGLLPQKPQMRGVHPLQQMRISTHTGKPIKTDANGTQLCSALGCNHAARIKGMCKLHGGGRRCKVDGCMKSAQTGHLCIAHGGGKPCNVEGCPKTAQSRGLCKQHGGGVRCKFEGCTKSCQSGGFCRGHGGGKRCEYPNCTKWAQKNGHCAKHAQEVAAQQMQQQQALQAQLHHQQLVHP
ncbi:hypothetical protein PsorP6_006450 [Peronosclerospora sorghi]|uniref:Uncharacterized protein n=1 Tax=Peronosclerospora sorghi TaxID=230839 RepID=A0ACC0W2B4_9STRA|nr:hypothetical protein PsorP6_006450 [Peronosclerospora sorghi]